MAIEPVPQIPNEGAVRLERMGVVAQLTLSRPAALNAITWTMYEQLEHHLEQIASDSSTRVVIVRGEGGRAFAAGTDISQFAGFTGEDGVRYERRLDAVVDRVANLPQPVLAAVEGYAVGGGLLFAAACDLRYATPTAQFGVPVARTLGNCLSLKNYHVLVSALGAMRAKELLFTGRLLSATEAMSAGFVTAIFDAADFAERVLDIARGIAEQAPLTQWAAKEAQRRLDAAAAARIGEVPFDDVVARVYGSADFREGIEAHLQKRRPVWRGE